MKKRLIGVILTLALLLAVCGLGAVSVSAADTATVKVGGKSYTVKVGDYVEYKVAFRFSGKNLAAAQIELPVDFTGLSGYSKDEIGVHLNRIAPATGSSSVVERFDKAGTTGVVGYVMNFVSPTGYSFESEKTVLSLIFGVEKAGTYELAAKVRYVDDINERTIVNGSYKKIDTRFSYSESLAEAVLDTPVLKVSTDYGGLKIAWDPVPRASQYRVFYKGRNGWTKLTDTKSTSVLDSVVTSGSSYTYTVRCLSADGTRYISDYDHDGESAVYYAAPSLKLSNAEDAVSIKWDASPHAAKYRVYYKSSSGWKKLADTAATSLLDADVRSGTRYTYTIRTMDANGNLLSGFNPDGFSVTFISAPSFSLSKAADGVQISWNKVTGAAKYRVFYYGSSGWSRLVDTAGTSFIDTDVRSDRSYTYTVRCLSADGSAYTSDYRSGQSIKFYAAPILKLSNAEDGVSIKWDAISGASRYRIYYKSGSSWKTLTDTTGTSVIDSDVASGTNYTYTIRAMDSSGNHLSWYYTDGFHIQFIRAPEFKVSNAADGVQISWNEPGGAKKYRVFYYGSKGWTRLTDTTESSFIDTDVRSGRTYTYTVRCLSEDSTAYTSSFRTGRSITYYAAPKLTLANTASGVSMKWDAVSGASKYRIFLKNGSSWTRLADTASTSYIHTGVTEGTAYTYTIRAMDGSGNYLSSFYTDGFSITYKKP